jgi:hypothetical protein
MVMMSAVCTRPPNDSLQRLWQDNHAGCKTKSTPMMRSILGSLFPVILMLVFSPYTLRAQVYSNKVVGKKQADEIETIKASEYPYALPILGAKATARGFNLPYSAGLGINYLWPSMDFLAHATN